MTQKGKRSQRTLQKYLLYKFITKSNKCLCCIYLVIIFESMVTQVYEVVSEEKLSENV
jgi:hypothetical protein